MYIREADIIMCADMCIILIMIKMPEYWHTFQHHALLSVYILARKTFQYSLHTIDWRQPRHTVTFHDIMWHLMSWHQCVQVNLSETLKITWPWPLTYDFYFRTDQWYCQGYPLHQKFEWVCQTVQLGDGCPTDWHALTHRNDRFYILDRHGGRKWIIAK